MWRRLARRGRKRAVETAPRRLKPRSRPAAAGACQHSRFSGWVTASCGSSPRRWALWPAGLRGAVSTARPPRDLQPTILRERVAEQGQGVAPEGGGDRAAVAADEVVGEEAL